MNTTLTNTKYKQTEIGLIPEDTTLNLPKGWELKKISDIANIATGNKDTQDKIDDGKYPFYVRSQTIERINSYSFEGEAVLTSGDGVGVGKIFHYVNGKFDFHQRVYCVYDFKKYDGRFFYYYFSDRFYGRVMQMTAKSSVDSVRKEMIWNMLVPKPPLNEQKAIATALSDTDSWIESLEKLIAKKKAIKQGAMQELLTGRVRLRSATGEVFEGEWEEKSFEEMLDYEQPPKYIIKGKILEKGNTPVLTANKAFVLGYTNEETGVFKKWPVIIFDDFTTLSKYVDFNFKVKSSAIKILNTKSKFNLEFIYNRMKILDFQVGDHKRHYISEYQNIKINVPDFQEQTAIAQVLSDMDQEIEGLEAKLEKARKIKTGMMQQLLTGKIRLPYEQ